MNLFKDLVFEQKPKKIKTWTDTYGDEQVTFVCDRSVEASELETSVEIFNSMPPDVLELLKESILDGNNTIGRQIEAVELLDYFLDPNVMMEKNKFFSEQVYYDFAQQAIYLVSDSRDEELYTGLDMFEAYGVICNNFPHYAKNHLRDMVAYIHSCEYGYKYFSKFVDDWNKCLKIFRDQRKAFGAMDKMTKYTQLDMIDDDCLYDRADLGLVDFVVVPDPDEPPPFYVDMFAPVVRKPPIRFEYEEISARRSMNYYYFSNIIDKNGNNDYTRLEKIWDNYYANIDQDDAPFIVECMMDHRFPSFYYGGVLRKPRPHNLHVVIELTVPELGHNIARLFESNIKDVIESNIVRNRQLVENGDRDTIKKIRYPPDEVSGRIKNPSFQKNNFKTVKKKRRGPAETRQAKHMNEFYHLCKDLNSPHYMKTEKWPNIMLNYVPKGAFLSHYVYNVPPKALFRFLYENCPHPSYGVNGWYG